MKNHYSWNTNTIQLSVLDLCCSEVPGWYFRPNYTGYIFPVPRLNWDVLCGNSTNVMFSCRLSLLTGTKHTGHWDVTYPQCAFQYNSEVGLQYVSWKDQCTSATQNTAITLTQSINSIMKCVFCHYSLPLLQHYEVRNTDVFTNSQKAMVVFLHRLV